MWLVLGLVVFFLAYVWLSADTDRGDHSTAADEAFAEMAKPMKIVYPGQLFASSLPMTFPDEHQDF